MIATFTGSVFLGFGVAAAGACLGRRGTGREGSRELWKGAAAAANSGGERDFRRFCFSRCWRGYGRVLKLLVGTESPAIHAVLHAAR